MARKCHGVIKCVCQLARLDTSFVVGYRSSRSGDVNASSLAMTERCVATFESLAFDQSNTVRSAGSFKIQHACWQHSM